MKLVKIVFVGGVERKFILENEFSDNLIYIFRNGNKRARIKDNYYINLENVLEIEILEIKEIE